MRRKQPQLSWQANLLTTTFARSLCTASCSLAGVTFARWSIVWTWLGNHSVGPPFAKLNFKLKIFKKIINYESMNSNLRWQLFKKQYLWKRNRFKWSRHKLFDNIDCAFRSVNLFFNFGTPYNTSSLNYYEIEMWMIQFNFKWWENFHRNIYNLNFFDIETIKYLWKLNLPYVNLKNRDWFFNFNFLN